MKRLLAMFGFSLFSHVAQAAPQINVGVVYDYLDGDKSSYLKRIFNGGDSTAFVKINILEIIYDADGNAREIPLVNQTDGTSRDGLMASPARLIVPANGLQGSRLLYLGRARKNVIFACVLCPSCQKGKMNLPSRQKNVTTIKEPVGRGQRTCRLWHGVLRPAQGDPF